MHGLGIIRPITKIERLNLEKLHKGCESPGCPKQPECAIARERSSETILAFVCIDHARSWADNEEDAGADAPGSSDEEA